MTSEPQATDLQHSLVVESGKNAGQSIELPPGKFLVGREEDCHLRPNSDLVSRHHCVFIVDEFAVRLRDLGSTNGTFVNDEQLHGAVTLKADDRVRIGSLEFRFSPAGESAASENDQPEPQSGMDTAAVIQVDAPTVIDAPQEEAPAEPAPPTEPAAAEAPEYPPEPEAIPGGQTMFGMPHPGTVPPGDTTFTPPPGQGMPQQPMVSFPPPPYGQPGYPPQAYPQQPGYPPQAYPQQPGYPPQAYPQPGYPQGYPPQGMPQPGYPAPAPVPAEPAPVEEQAAEPSAASASTPDIRLPDPSETGAKAPEPKPETKPEEGGEEKPANIPDTASAIIKNYLERRPGQ